MLNIQTQNRLAKLLYQIAHTEKVVQQSRKELSKHSQFDPEHIFKTLDRLKQKSLNMFDLKDLQAKAGVFSNPQDLQLLIAQYDSNNNKSLSKSDFFQLVLPSQTTYLRKKPLYKGRLEGISNSIQSLLAHHIQLQATQQAHLDFLKRSLITSSDYSHILGFRSIDCEGFQAIYPIQLLTFLRKHDFSVNETIIEGIMRRLDSDGDGKLSFQEFQQGVGYQARIKENFIYRKRFCSPLNKKHSPVFKVNNLREVRFLSPVGSKDLSFIPEPRNSSPLKQNKSVFIRTQILQSVRDKENQKMNQPVRVSHHYRNNQPVRAFSHASKNSSLRFSQLPLRQYTRNYSPISLKTQSSIRTSLISKLSRSYMQEIAYTFKKQIKLDQAIQRVKISLVDQTDFTYLDFFRLFDLQNKGYINLQDFQSLFRDLKIQSRQNDSYLLFRRFSREKDFKIFFNQFCGMFMPRDSYYRGVLDGRKPLNTPPVDRMEAFSQISIKKIRNALNVYIESEKKTEKIRQRIVNKKQIDLIDVFRIIDRNNDGLITKDDFLVFLRQFGMEASAYDLEGLLERYGKTDKESVSYSEFIQEISPKIG